MSSESPRLHVSLLDKLAQNTVRPSIRTQQDYIGTILRDLTFLLNTPAPFSRDAELSKTFPHVASSVMNYGWIDLIGRTVSENTYVSFHRRLKEAILDFEPRIDPESLDLKLTAPSRLSGAEYMVSFEIRGLLLLNPMPIEFALQTLIDGGEGVASVIGISAS